MWILWSHVLLGISLAAPIGPLNFEILKRGITKGFLSSWFVGIGGLIANFIFLLAVHFGVSAFLKIHWIQITLAMLGASFLMQMGLSSMRQGVRGIEIASNETSIGRKDLWDSLRTGILINLSNPICIMFWVGVYGSLYVSMMNKLSGKMVILSVLAFFLGIALWNLNVAATVHFSRGNMNPRVLQGVMLLAGFMLCLFGIKFAWQGMRLIGKL